MHSSPPDDHSSRRRRRQWLLLLMALLMSFSCVFSSTWLAISRPPQRLAVAALLPGSKADYGKSRGESHGFAPLHPDVAAEAARDSSSLRLTLPASVGGSPSAVAVVLLPPTPTASLAPTLAPVASASSSPYATATVVRSPATPTATAQTPTGTPTRALATPTGIATNTPPPMVAATGAMSPTATPPGTPTPTATFLPTATMMPTPTEAPPDPPDATNTPTPAPSPTATYMPSPANRAPVTLDDTAVADEDAPATTIHVVANDTDPDMNLDASSVTGVTNPVSGTLGIATSGDITYTPFANLHGVDTFTYQVCDAGMPVLCDTAIVTVTILPVNDPPTANDDEAYVALDTPTAIAVLLNDSDVDGNLDVTSVAAVIDPSGGTSSVDASGVITYTPDPSFAGSDSFSYQVCDTGVPVLCSTATVTVSVNNLALGKPSEVSSSHNDQQQGDKAVDGKIGTSWRTADSSALPSEWMVVDLGSTVSVSQAVLRWDNAYATSYTIQVSPDNLAWTPVFTTTVGDGDIDTLTFSTTSARYMKFESTAWSGEPWRIWLQEFEIYP